MEDEKLVKLILYLFLVPFFQSRKNGTQKIDPLKKFVLPLSSPALKSFNSSWKYTNFQTGNDFLRFDSDHFLQQNLFRPDYYYLLLKSNNPYPGNFCLTRGGRQAVISVYDCYLQQEV